MERRIEIDGKTITTDDPHGVLAHTVDPRTGRPGVDTERTRSEQAAPLPPEGFPNPAEPLGQIAAQSALFSRIYHGQAGGTALFATALVWLLPVFFLAQIPFDLVDVPAVGKYVMAAVPVVLYGWFFGHAVVARGRRKAA
ncbi:hypothetical protein [Luteibacter yeojuensis]|uniref:Uncharacterized protein n=1 Tax=Luteibacter yeojuensis TaxID=345309 RepID=A0A0F3KSS4_9GAMM|nr:hypothetical protein [Luteibacter yeojuensis]KJV33154.1 hypothetical protein VI08_11455 [Luteibacter yeojuensis]